MHKHSSNSRQKAYRITKGKKYSKSNKYFFYQNNNSDFFSLEFNEKLPRLKRGIPNDNIKLNLNAHLNNFFNRKTNNFVLLWL